jgi:carboxymethylenebutenolidase
MAQTIEIATPDGTAEAFLAGAPGRPGVLLYIDAIGLRPQIEEMVETVASWGYVVLAPNVFYRDGTAAELAPTEDLRDPGAREAFFAGGVMERVRALTPALAATDGAAYVAALRQRAGDGPIGVVGYCMGARLAVRLAGQFPGTVAAVAGFHGGGLVTDAADSPHRAIASSTAEFVFGHADQDPSMPVEAVSALEETLQAAGRAHVNEIYAGAAHGYSMADTSVYDEAGATRSFHALRDLLDRTL